MDKSDIDKLPIEFAQFVIDAMRDQRKRDAELIKAYADQLPDGHSAKKYIIEISNTLLAQA